MIGLLQIYRNILRESISHDHLFWPHAMSVTALNYMMTVQVREVTTGTDTEIFSTEAMGT